MAKYILYIIILFSPISVYSQILHELLVIDLGSTCNQQSFFIGAKYNNVKSTLKLFDVRRTTNNKYYFDINCQQGPFRFRLMMNEFNLNYSFEDYLIGFDIIPYDKYSNNKTTFSFIPSLFSISWRILNYSQREELIKILGDEEIVDKLMMIPAIIINSKHCLSFYSNHNVNNFKDLSFFLRSKLDFFLENDNSNLWRYQPEAGFQYMFTFANGDDATGIVTSIGVKYIIDLIKGDFKKPSFQPSINIGYFLGSIWKPTMSTP